jgi:hypothetical protein
MSIDMIPILTIWILGDFLLNHIDHNIITHKTSLVHNLFCRLAQRSLLRNLSTKHISRRKMTDTILILNIKRLRTLPYPKISITTRQSISAIVGTYQHQEVPSTPFSIPHLHEPVQL